MYIVHIHIQEPKYLSNNNNNYKNSNSNNNNDDDDNSNNNNYNNNNSDNDDSSSSSSRKVNDASLCAVARKMMTGLDDSMNLLRWRYHGYQ